jgi:hypothetical protein
VVVRSWRLPRPPPPPRRRLWAGCGGGGGGGGGGGAPGTAARNQNRKIILEFVEDAALIVDIIIVMMMTVIIIVVVINIVIAKIIMIISIIIAMIIVVIMITRNANIVIIARKSGEARGLPLPAFSPQCWTLNRPFLIRLLTFLASMMNPSIFSLVGWMLNPYIGRVAAPALNSSFVTINSIFIAIISSLTSQHLLPPALSL